jgi:hypothetical protein
LSDNPASPPKVKAAHEVQGEHSPGNSSSSPPNTAVKAHNKNSEQAIPSSGKEVRQNRKRKAKNPEPNVTERKEQTSDNLSTKTSNLVPPSEILTALIQNRRSPRLHPLLSTSGTEEGQKPEKIQKRTSSRQEPKGSILTAFSSASSPKKQKMARASPQPSVSSSTMTMSTEVEHSANNGRIISGESEHSLSNPPSQIPEKTQNCGKT